MKKKILSLCLVIALAATAIVSGTLAYFKDTDAQENVFVVGNVAIDLYEDFGDNDGIEKLIPTTGKDAEGNYTNAIEKEVYVENTGSEKTYVRVHIAIPQILDDGAETFDASANILHFNYSPESVEDGKWNWSKTVDGTTGENWNYYEVAIDEITYNVYVVTYETILEKGDVTIDAMSQVYMDSKVTNEDITKLKETLGDNWKIYVAAEAGQADGFTDAYTALNTQFGTPGTYTVEFDAEAEHKLYVEGEDERLTDITATVSADGALASATYTVDGNHITYTLDGITLSKATNPAGVEAYWAGYLTFTAPDYADITKATFTRNGEVKSWAVCEDDTTNHTMQAWTAASVADKDVHQTYTFDWDGDGVYEAIYSVHVTNITFAD